MGCGSRAGDGAALRTLNLNVLSVLDAFASLVPPWMDVEDWHPSRQNPMTMAVPASKRIVRSGHNQRKNLRILHLHHNGWG